MHPVATIHGRGIRRRLRAERAGRMRRVPVAWREEMAGVLITRAEIARRVNKMAARLERDYRGRDLFVVAILNGTVLFLADLIRGLSLPMRLDFAGVSSYGGGTDPGELVLTKDLGGGVRGRDVLLVDDILDTGQTLNYLLKRLRGLSPRSLRSCVLLDKPARRRVAVQADYVGFEIPDTFVVGYGLDFQERYRNLPFIGVLKEEYQAGDGNEGGSSCR